MLADASKLNIVRVGSDITYTSLKEIGDKILGSFRGIIQEFNISHHNTPVLDSIDPCCSPWCFMKNSAAIPWVSRMPI